MLRALQHISRKPKCKEIVMQLHCLEAEQVQQLDAIDTALAKRAKQLGVCRCATIIEA